MRPLRPSEESRRIGRYLYFSAALTLGFHYGITVELEKPLVLKIPEGFPLVGIATLICLLLLISLFARLMDEVADFAFGTAYRAVTVPPQPIGLEEVTKYEPDSTMRSSVVAHAPKMRAISSYIIFALDIVLPAVFSIYIVSRFFGSIYTIVTMKG